MKKILFYINVYFACALQDIKVKMSYRTDFLIGLIGVLAINISSLVTFWVVFKNIQDINGWSYYEMFFIYAFYLIVSAPFQLVFDNIWMLEQYLRDGSFIKYYFRPVNIFFYFISESFNIKAIGQVFIGLCFLYYAWMKLNLEVSSFSVLNLLIQMIGGVLVYTAIMVAGSAISFWGINQNSILSLISRLTTYSIYPFSIFNTVIRMILSWILPLAFIAYYPSLNILKSHQVGMMSVVSPLVGVAAFVAAYKFWMQGARIFVGTGS